MCSYLTFKMVPEILYDVNVWAIWWPWQKIDMVLVEQASKYALGHCPVENSGHDNLGQGLGRYPGGRPAISRSTTPC